MILRVGSIPSPVVFKRNPVGPSSLELVAAVPMEESSSQVLKVEADLTELIIPLLRITMFC